MLTDYCTLSRKDIGFVGLGCEGLKNARHLEAMAMVWIPLVFVEDYGMKCVFKFSCA